MKLLYYTEIGLSPYEVPEHNSICIYISGCCNHCKNCHYPMLQKSNFGDKILVNFLKIIQLYQNQATCVCFLGEGENTTYEHQEFYKMVRIAKSHNLQTCLYCGRDTDVEEWMSIFDFVKLGSYQEKLGGLNCETTNQKLLEKVEDKYKDITCEFWK